MGFFGLRKSPAKVAKERLRMVLIQDRSLMSPQMLSNMKRDIIKVISNYIEIDHSGIDIEIDSTDTSTTLVANIPIKQIKHGVF